MASNPHGELVGVELDLIRGEVDVVRRRLDGEIAFLLLLSDTLYFWRLIRGRNAYAATFCHFLGRFLAAFALANVRILLIDVLKTARALSRSSNFVWQFFLGLFCMFNLSDKNFRVVLLNNKYYWR